MKKEILIIKKEEAYTYDELDFLEQGNSASPTVIAADNFSVMENI